MSRIGVVAILVLCLIGVRAQLKAEMGFMVDGSGLFWILGPDGNDIIFRMTPNIGVEDFNVLDVEDLVATEVLSRVEYPDFADVEKEWATSYIDGAGDPVGIDIKQRMYNWSEADFMITRYRIFNNTEELFAPFVSFEIIPTLDGPGQYGGETTDLLIDEQIGFMHEAERFLGLRFLDKPMFSYRSPGYADFESAENQEAFRYAEMSNPSNSDFPTTDDYGMLVFFNAGEYGLSPGDSLEMYVALGYGTTETNMRVAILDVDDLYEGWLAPADFEVGISPTSLQLGLNYPNPVLGATIFPIVVTNAADISLDIFDIVGRRVAVVHSGFLEPGNYEMPWNGRDMWDDPVRSGVYFCRLQTDCSGTREQECSRRVVVVR